MQKQQISKVAASVSVLYGTIICLLPLHALLTTWLGSSFGALDVWRIWKELLIVSSLPLVAYVVWRTPQLRRQLRTDRLVQLIGVYIVVHLLTSVHAIIVQTVSPMAVVYGLLANLRFVGFFVLVYAVASVAPRYWRFVPHMTGVVAAGVVGFGLLQRFVLPMDALRHLGYGPNTIPAVHTVDNKPAYQRLQSTLRGPNPLGAYLVVVLLGAAAWLRRHVRSVRWYAVLTGATLGLVVLWYSYSRSAYLGLILGSVWMAFMALRSRRARMLCLAFVVTGLLLFGSGLYAMRDNDYVQNALFHSDETSRSPESSNTKRAQALQNGLRDVVAEPFGRGPGSAGPASTRNTEQPGRIAENYYIQIAQEVGWFGITVFVLVNAVVARRLYRLRGDWVADALLASLIGITLINMMSHAWADDTLGLLWWGLAAMTLATRSR